ncbi:PDR/VanB family oxidoreductase [Geodermatophilus sabuli]|uniref:Vanillate O-demethylase ferredoxin subunit n=1 Tax=Geodermatophilus sabuli TaxID=1564158 RepID=A0A285EE42_9ACTN|nr:PDR/VanB family oxidoreductase [Geodermatophilus sabuli]MBB3084411.1 vanillate O-demethylase ferredoxin subunit [Geodermatophilus sabuli]SNX96321.1 vanillate O-demethylase ferredoxin subunit [Geodermatophilus sabuli]
MSVVVRVAEITEETPSIRTLRLVRLDGNSFTPGVYKAGAHVDVTGPTGIVRQYSLCSPPGDPSSLLIAVKREPESRGGSVALHQLTVGDHLKLSKPRNLLQLAEDGDRHVLVAGGIGITPLLSMAYELYSWGAEFELHYFARSRDEAAFVDLLENRVEFPDRVHWHFGVAPADLPAVLQGLGAALTSDGHVYTCGPAPFMAQVTTALAPVVGEEHVHVEHFVPVEVDTRGDEPFTVELDTGESFEVPADRSILSVLEENGIEVFKSCEEGICGSCVSGVLQGTPDHRDNCLSAADKAAGKEMALCVSRALTDRLVIELY